MQAKSDIYFPKVPVHSHYQPPKFALNATAVWMEKKMQIARSIRRARERKDYTQEYVAEELALTVSTYSKIERGVTALKMEVAMRLAEIFDISLDELIGKEAKNDSAVSEPTGQYGKSMPSQVVFVFNNVEKRSAKADKFLRRLTDVLREFDLTDMQDFLDDDE